MEKLLEAFHATIVLPSCSMKIQDSLDMQHFNIVEKSGCRNHTELCINEGTSPSSKNDTKKYQTSPRKALTLLEADHHILLYVVGRFREKGVKN